MSCGRKYTCTDGLSYIFKKPTLASHIINFNDVWRPSNCVVETDEIRRLRRDQTRRRPGKTRLFVV